MVTEESIQQEIRDTKLELRNTEIRRDTLFKEIEVDKAELDTMPIPEEEPVEGEPTERETLEEIIQEKEERLHGLEATEDSLQSQIGGLLEQLQDFLVTGNIRAIDTLGVTRIPVGHIHVQGNKPLDGIDMGMVDVTLAEGRYDLIELVVDDNGSSDRFGDSMFRITDGYWKYDIYEEAIKFRVYKVVDTVK